MTRNDFLRLNRAAKSIETDACEAYYSTQEKFGSDVAGALCILFLRMRLNPKQQWPAPEGVEEKIAVILRDKGILTDV